jgi:hypothetical protein
MEERYQSNNPAPKEDEIEDMEEEKWEFTLRNNNATMKQGTAKLSASQTSRDKTRFIFVTGGRGSVVLNWKEDGAEWIFCKTNPNNSHNDKCFKYWFGIISK